MPSSSQSCRKLVRSIRRVHVRQQDRASSVCPNKIACITASPLERTKMEEPSPNKKLKIVISLLSDVEDDEIDLDKKLPRSQTRNTVLK